jgi:hypothetical protein
MLTSLIHFGRRGRENLASLTRKDFAVKQDSDCALYVYKTTDEMFIWFFNRFDVKHY